MVGSFHDFGLNDSPFPRSNHLIRLIRSCIKILLLILILSQAEYFLHKMQIILPRIKMHFDRISDVKSTGRVRRLLLEFVQEGEVRKESWFTFCVFPRVRKKYSGQEDMRLLSAEHREESYAKKSSPWHDHVTWPSRKNMSLIWDPDLLLLLIWIDGRSLILKERTSSHPSSDSQDSICIPFRELRRAVVYSMI